VRIEFGNWWKKYKGVYSIIPFSLIIIYEPEIVLNITIMNFSCNINFSVSDKK